MATSKSATNDPDVLVLGAGAAGLMCALEAGKRGRRVLVLEKAKSIGEKIRISGGGRCNFTNLHTSPENFLSENPHFCRSALSRFSPQDFVSMIDEAGIPWHEKKLGQLFCTPRGGARLVVEMLRSACEATGNVSFRCNIEVSRVETDSRGFRILANGQPLLGSSLVIATGGPSIPQIGATGFGYEVAEQFKLEVIRPRPALVPLTLSKEKSTAVRKLSGVSLPVLVSCHQGQFREAILFTHRGLSGPAILQISSYWEPGDDIHLDLLPDRQIQDLLAQSRDQTPKRSLSRVLEAYIPKRLAAEITAEVGHSGTVSQISTQTRRALQTRIHDWTLRPSGTEGFRTAEVTRGGVDTQELSSKTMEAKKQPGLYFIGEVVDVTGHLGGFNFQWAWASGYAAGQSA